MIKVLGEREMTSADMDLDTARERIASEQLIKLDEATTVNATAVKLSWKVKLCGCSIITKKRPLKLSKGCYHCPSLSVLVNNLLLF